MVLCSSQGTNLKILQQTHSHSLEKSQSQEIEKQSGNTSRVQLNFNINLKFWGLPELLCINFFQKGKCKMFLMQLPTTICQIYQIMGNTVSGNVSEEVEKIPTDMKKIITNASLKFTHKVCSNGIQHIQQHKNTCSQLTLEKVVYLLGYIQCS